MAALHDFSAFETATNDPLLPFLWSVKKALEDSRENLTELLRGCTANFKDSDQYRNDVRFLKIWLLYMDVSSDFHSVFVEILNSRVCANNSSLYVWSACFFESKGRFRDALIVYNLGISRNAEPIDWLKNAHTLFLSRISEIWSAVSSQKIDDKGNTEFGNNGSNPWDTSTIPLQVVHHTLLEPAKWVQPVGLGPFNPLFWRVEIDDKRSTELGSDNINPWDSSTIEFLLKKIAPLISKFNGYHLSTKSYTGKVALSTLKNASRNKVIEIGGKKYHIKGCAGQGGFAQVYKAYVYSDPNDVVALKIQKPAFSWEFYMYRQLDQRILGKERSSYGYAHRIHLYSDCSILICDYLAHGTLQDVINSYVVLGKSMEEVLCIYYTIEMLHMVETLHGVGLIHGDFKPDNMLIRYASGTLTEDGFLDRSGPWCDQGLCLVDWGRGIDLHLFPDHMVFKGDSLTSGFRCIEMQEDKPWKFQSDAYGICVIVHMMLHNTYMEIAKKESSDGGYKYLPRLPFKRYWNTELWTNFFIKMVNEYPGNDDRRLLQELKKSFLDYMGSDPKLIKTLKELLMKQRTSLCTA